MDKGKGRMSEAETEDSEEEMDEKAVRVCNSINIQNVI